MSDNISSNEALTIESIYERFSVGNRLVAGQIQDTAITDKHHDIPINKGMTRIDEIKIIRQLEKLNSKEYQREHYFNEL